MMRRLPKIGGRQLFRALSIGGLLVVVVILALSFVGQRSKGLESGSVSIRDLERQEERQLESFSKAKLLAQGQITETIANTIFNSSKGGTEIVSFRSKEASQKFPKVEYPTVETSLEIKGKSAELVAILEKLINDTKGSMVIDSLEGLTGGADIWTLRFHSKVYAEPK
ncbi:MAG: hypothetical protein HY666_04985 [Chloroflexi bacterium]|nr:hypothetical protein [Chloroflexota bacterium]